MSKVKLISSTDKTTSSLPLAMRIRFKSAFEASKYSSLRRLSKDADCNEAQAARIMRGHFDDAKDGPGLFGVWRMAEKMGIGLTDLVPANLGRNHRPQMSEFFACYKPGNAHVSDFASVLEYCDQYAEPKGGRCRVLEVGSRSLLAEKTEMSDPALQQAEFDGWSNERRNRIYQWQRRAWDVGAIAEPEDFTGDYRAVDRSIRIMILRAGCRVLGDDLKPRLLVYCQQIW